MRSKLGEIDHERAIALLMVLKRDRHQLRLLAVCTNCETPFLIPALWVRGGVSPLFSTVCYDSETPKVALMLKKLYPQKLLTSSKQISSAIAPFSFN